MSGRSAARFGRVGLEHCLRRRDAAYGNDTAKDKALDPQAGVLAAGEWHPDFVNQCDVTTNQFGDRRWEGRGEQTD
jgi:hypothetical protein